MACMVATHMNTVHMHKHFTTWSLELYGTQDY